MPGGMALEEHLVAPTGMVRSTKEVVEADLVQSGSFGVGRDVPTDAEPGTLGPMNQHSGVPPDEPPKRTL